MDDIAERYARVSAAFASKVAAVPDDRWDAPSPCDDWTALDIVEHVVDSHRQFLGFVDREMHPAPPTRKDPVGAFDVARAQVLADLRDPERAAATYVGHLGERTFAWAVDGFLASDLVIHGWDLARATGQDDTIDPQEITRILTDTEGMGDMARAPGVYGPALDVADDADAQTRLLAFVGRRA